MRPANVQQAIRHMEHLLVRKLTGSRRNRVREHLTRATQIAGIIYGQFQVGPYQYQLKHLHWYLETQTHTLKPATRYRHWLTARIIINARDKSDNWLPRLQGAWTQPMKPESAVD